MWICRKEKDMKVKERETIMDVGSERGECDKKK
jgi:hypothetical protein